MTGFNQAGGTALFEALCLARGVALPARKHHEPRIVRLPISDPIFEQVAERFKPRKVVPPAMELRECPEIPEQPERIHGLLATVAQGLSLITLVCGGNAVDTDFSPERAVTDYFFAVTDAQRAIVKRRLEQIYASVRKGKKEESALVAPLESILRRLEVPGPISGQTLTREEITVSANFVLITAIPHFVVVNTGNPERANAWQKEWSLPIPLFFADVFLERDLLELPEAERSEFMAEYGLKQLSVATLLERLKDATNRVVFYTLNERELHAWDVPRGTDALHAAGVIHSDMERGFIRAEIVSAQDLLRAGSFANAHQTGLVRTESKQYVVKDRDILTIHFNV